MIRKLAPYTKGYRVYILLGILCSAGEAVLELMLPKAMSNIVDYGIGGNGGAGDRSYILTMGLKMVLMALICLALGVGAAALAAKAGMGFGANVRDAEYRQVQRFSFSNIELKFSGVGTDPVKPGTAYVVSVSKYRHNISKTAKFSVLHGCVISSGQSAY